MIAAKIFLVVQCALVGAGIPWAIVTAIKARRADRNAVARYTRYR